MRNAASEKRVSLSQSCVGSSLTVSQFGEVSDMPTGALVTQPQSFQWTGMQLAIMAFETIEFKF